MNVVELDGGSRMKFSFHLDVNSPNCFELPRNNKMWACSDFELKIAFFQSMDQTAKHFL